MQYSHYRSSGLYSIRSLPRYRWMPFPLDVICQRIASSTPALEIVVGILLLTIYPEIKRDVVSCLYESEQIPRYGRLEDSHYAGLRP